MANRPETGRKRAASAPEKKSSASKADQPKSEKLSALEKALKIINALTEHPRPVGLPDLTKMLGLPKQTVHRQLLQLEANGLVLREIDRDRYSLGPQCTALALTVLKSTNHAAPTRAILANLVKNLNETCNIGVLDGLDFLYIDRVECDWSLRIHLQAGTRVPAYCVSGGKIMLASLSEDDRNALLGSVTLKKYTNKTLTRMAEVNDEIAKVAAQGYAVNNGEYTDGVLGVAVPIRDKNGRVLAALAMHGPQPRMTMDNAVAAVPKLKETAAKLAAAWQVQDGEASPPARRKTKSSKAAGD